LNGWSRITVHLFVHPAVQRASTEEFSANGGIADCKCVILTVNLAVSPTCGRTPPVAQLEMPLDLKNITGQANEFSARFPFSRNPKRKARIPLTHRLRPQCAALSEMSLIQHADIKALGHGPPG